jgi:hypothetical protein
MDYSEVAPDGLEATIIEGLKAVGPAIRLTFALSGGPEYILGSAEIKNEIKIPVERVAYLKKDRRARPRQIRTRRTRWTGDF